MTYIFLRTGQIAYTKLRMVFSRWHKNSDELTGKKISGIDKKFGLKWQKAQVGKIKARLTSKNLVEKSEGDEISSNESKQPSSLSPSFKRKYPRLKEKLVIVKHQFAKKSETAKNTANLITSDIKQELPHIKNKANSLKRNLSQKKLVEDDLADIKDKNPSVFEKKVSTLKRSMSEKGKSIKDTSSAWNSTLTKNVTQKKQAIKEATADWKEKSLAIVQRKKPEQGP